MEIDLPTIWAGLLAISIAAYVILDGFDLGIGILFPALRDHEARAKAMNSIAPVWDGNETWLVLGGGGLFAAFPMAYAIVLPAVYPLIIAMLLGLVFRGVAFEFRWRDESHRGIWDWAFFFGSLTATLAQGITLGAIVQGIEVDGRAYGGGWWDWLTPFSLLTGVSLVAGYALLGAGWLVMKTDGKIQHHIKRMMRVLLPVLLVSIGVVSLYTPFLDNGYFGRWFAFPGLIYAAPVPLLVLACAFGAWRGLDGDKDALPFLFSLAIFLLTLIGLGISLWPYAVPQAVTIWQAAAPPASQGFMLIGAGILLPVILAYTAWAFWVFRGKVADEGYH